MANFGYTLMTEQTGPTALVRDAVAAERAGFDFEVMSDHYFPWLDSQGHAPNAWVTLGAVAAATERVELMTYVTCPTVRYHPAVVAQQAATVEMLAEAIDIIRALFDGGYVNFVGDHFRVDSAKLWDLGDPPPRIGVAVSGAQSCELAGGRADLMIAVEPDASLGEKFDAAGGAGKPRVGQMPISFGTDKGAAVTRAHSLFRWFGLGWKVNAELPGPPAFDAASQFVREDDVAEGIPCGDDVDAVLTAAKAYADAGFTQLALVQIGGDQQAPFIEWAQQTLMPAWREAFAA
jgi:alkanesulfonate monooxygenase SsuD/methylene tetrahydromethanopterin reductase-like flavin-dependent oxidoreductase (luciferase family)